MLKPFKGTAVGIIDHSRSTANRQFTLNKDYHAAVFLLFWACLPFFEVYIYNFIFILRCCYPIFFFVLSLDLSLMCCCFCFTFLLFLPSFSDADTGQKNSLIYKAVASQCPSPDGSLSVSTKKKEKILRWVCAVHFILFV